MEEAVILDFAQFLQALNTTALAAFAAAMAMGWLIPASVVKVQIVGPLMERINTLEKALAQKEAEQRETLRTLAATLETQSRLLERYERGGD